MKYGRDCPAKDAGPTRIGIDIGVIKLGRIDIQRSQIIVAARWTKPVK